MFVTTAFATSSSSSSDGDSGSSKSGDSSGGGDNNDNSANDEKTQAHINALRDLTKDVQANGPRVHFDCIGKPECLNKSDGNNNNDGITDKIGTINSLFRGGHHKGSITIPTIPQMQFPTTTANGTTANVTIAVCDGIVPGPCLDRTTGQIIP